MKIMGAVPVVNVIYMENIPGLSKNQNPAGVTNPAKREMIEIQIL